MVEVGGKWEGDDLSILLAPLIKKKQAEKFNESENSSGLLLIHFDSNHVLSLSEP